MSEDKKQSLGLIDLLLEKKFDLSQIDKVLSICETTEDLAECLVRDIFRLTGKSCSVATFSENYEKGDIVIFVDSVVEFSHVMTVSALVKTKKLVLAPFLLALSDGGHTSVPGVGEIVSLVQEEPK